MKNLLLTTAFAVFALFAHATIITVSNNPDSPGQYTDLQEAADEASPGDTIYIHGSNSSYGSITIRRQLTLIGTGYDPHNQWLLKSQVSGITLSKTDNGLQDASGTHIIGLNYSSIGNQANAANPINNVLITRSEGNSISLNQYCSGWSIRKNLIASCSMGGASNIVVQNNVIRGQISGVNNSTVLVTNNVFHKNSVTTVLSGNDYLTFTNNILINGTVGSGTNCENCTFNNNITTANTTFLYGSNTGGGNMVQTDPLCVDVGNGPNYPLLNDYTLQPGSPAIDAGTDGTDVGITGGSYPYTVYNENMPAIPQVIEMNIQNANIPVDEVLHIQVKARKQD